MKQAFVSVDISDPGQQFLVQESRLDGEFSAAKKVCEFFCLNGERLSTWSRKSVPPGEIPKLQASKSPWVDESQLPAALKSESRVCVPGKGSILSGHQEPPGHPKVNNPLRGDRAVFFRLLAACSASAMLRSQLHHNVLSSSMDRLDSAVNQLFCLEGWRSLERLPVRAEPCFQNLASTHTRIHASRDCLHLRQFRHALNSRGSEGARYEVG